MDGSVEVRPLPIPNRALPPEKPQPRDKIIGGNPRAIPLLARAKTLDSTMGNDPRALGRIEAFLRLKPMEWMNWGDQSSGVITQTAQFAAGVANTIQVAGAAKWADETRTAYQKGKTGFFDKKPAFYQQMLENASAMLKKAAQEIDQNKRALAEKLEPLRLDTLVFQVCTEGLTDATEIQIADGRLRTLLTSVQNGMALQATLEQSSLMVIKQIGDVSQVLTGLIPSWIMAQSKA